jgi:chemotaxis protein methyltransferase CheR
MFRDPIFYVTFRTKVIPILKTYPFIRIWHAGCSTGQEVYSMAILLQEEGIYERSRLYATDLNEYALKEAKDGVFPLAGMQENSRNYMESGGKKEFSDYYTARYDLARFDPSLTRNVVFAQHNLVTDGGFNEFNVIFCRNVLIYFNRALQNRVHEVFYESLCYLGFLCLGSRETVDFTPHELDYRQVELVEKIYQKIHATTL